MVLENMAYFAGMNQYARVAILFFALLIVLRIVLYFAEKILIKLTSKTKTDVDDIILAKSSKPLTLIAILVSLLFSLKEIVFTGDVETILVRSIYSLLVVTVGYLVFVIVNVSLKRVWKKISEKTESDIDDTLGNLVYEVLRVVLLLIALIIILNIWGVNIGPFLAGLGIAGLAVALALQPTLSNIFSGIFIVLDSSVKRGDVVKLEGGQMGEIFEIGLRATKIKSFDNELFIIPNSKLADSIIQNSFQPDLSIRVNVEFGVEYGVDPEYIKKLVIEEIGTIEFIDKEEEIRVLFTEMADNSLNFKAMFWVDDLAKKWPAHQEAMSKIYRRLYKEKIGIPYPQRTVWMRDEGKVKGPDPSDGKFSSVKGKYFSSFGHEYKEDEDTAEGDDVVEEEGK